jgi:hypothetical protein
MTPPAETVDLVARFADRHDVRRAVVSLERHGTVDADRIDLTGMVDTTDELGRRAADREAMNDFGKRSLTGSAIGAVSGAVLLGGIALITGVDPQPAAQLAAAAGGAGAGGALGFFYGIASRTPVTEDAVAGTATLDDEDAGPAELVIHLGDAADADGLGDELRRLGADAVEVRRTA